MFASYSGNVFESEVSYNVTYTSSGRKCASAIISASSCNGIICKHVLEVSSSSYPRFNHINVTVFASNIFGDGPSSQIIAISKFKRIMSPKIT